MLSLDKFNHNGYEILQLEDNIFLIKNFISDQEQNDILSIAKNASDAEWELDYYERKGKNHPIDLNDNWYKKALNIINSEYPEILQDRLQKIIGNSLKVRKFLTIQRHYPGTNLPEHVDKQYNEKLEYASVLYLNDDFNGGELFFPLKNIMIKPKAKDLIFFYTGEKYIHGVKTVLPGPTRYVIATFIWKQ